MSHAKSFNDILSAILYIGSDKPFSDAIESFINIYGLEIFQDIIHEQDYYWYYGNMAHNIILCIFDTKTMFHDENIPNFTYQQAADGLNCLWRMIINMGLNYKD